MQENNLKEERTRKSSRKHLRKKKNKKFVLILSFACLLTVLIIFLSRFIGIFPFNSFNSSSLLSSEQINILVIGLDKVEKVSRADSIVFLSIAPSTKEVVAISIPRDMRVEIPGRGKDKINPVYVFGGIDLISETVSSFLDVPLHFYVVVDFEGFVSIIDALGGVEIEVEKRMYYVDQAGGIKIDLYPGKQILNGEKALEYIRFRQDKLGDLGRIQRQQKLAMAIINKIMAPGSIMKIPQLLEEVKGCVQTNIELPKATALANLLSSIGPEKFEFETIQGEPVYIGGVNYLEPNLEEVRQRIKSLLYSPNNSIRVEIFNGNGLPGVAHRMAKELELQGFEIVNIDNADRFDYERTKVIVYSKGVNLDNQFKQLFKEGEIVKDYQDNTKSDVAIILGKDMTNSY